MVQQMEINECANTAWVGVCLQTRVCGFCWSKQIRSLRDENHSLCLSLWLRRQMFSLFPPLVSFHRFRPGLFLGLANRTQPPLRDAGDSHVIVTLPPGKIHICQFEWLIRKSTKNLNRWRRLSSVRSLSFLFHSPVILRHCPLYFYKVKAEKVNSWVICYFLYLGVSLDWKLSDCTKWLNIHFCVQSQMIYSKCCWLSQCWPNKHHQFKKKTFWVWSWKKDEFQTGLVCYYKTEHCWWTQALTTTPYKEECLTITQHFSFTDRSYLYLA